MQNFIPFYAFLSFYGYIPISVTYTKPFQLSLRRQLTFHISMSPTITHKML